MSSEIFYTIGFSLTIVVSIIGLIFSLLIIFSIINNRQCYTIYYLLICDLCVCIIIYLILCIVRSIYGLDKDWLSYQPKCAFRAYISMVAITASSHSFVIQSISRLFFSVFYTHKYLLTWRTHWILIILKWFICFSTSIEPFFFEHGFDILKGYRVCGNSVTILYVSLYTSFVLFIFPLSIVMIVYSIIFYQVRQSTRRVTRHMIQNTYINNLSSRYAKKSLKIMQNIMILMGIFLSSGISHLIVTFWEKFHPQSLPEQSFFVSANLITLSATIMIIYSFLKDKTMKNIALNYLYKRYSIVS